MDLELKSKRALVTGASQGIGAAVAQRLAKEGCDLLLTARNAANLNTIMAKLTADYGVVVETLPLDLAEPGSIDTLIAASGDIDILINNAGAIPAGRLADIAEDQWRQVWEVKLFGYINLTRALYGPMVARGGGVIINICGASGERPKAMYICGATANTALMSFSMALGGDSMQDGIRVIALNPGPVATERLIDLTKASAVEKLGDGERWQELWAPLPEGRPATVEEVADTVAFLASSRSAYTSGTVVTVDGGYCNRGSLM